LYSSLGASFELFILKALGKVLIFFFDSGIYRVHRQFAQGSDNFWAYVMTSTISSLACPDVITPSESRLNSISLFLHCKGIGND